MEISLSGHENLIEIEENLIDLLEEEEEKKKNKLTLSRVVLNNL